MIEFVSKEMMELLGEQTQGFWKKFAILVQEKITDKPRKLKLGTGRPKPMNNIEAKRFEKEKIPWGEYKGAYVGQVRMDYLEFLSEPDEFVINVRRYVASKHFKERRKNEL